MAGFLTLLLPFIFINFSSGEGTLNCNASLSEDDREYFAFIGDTVVLTYILPEGARDVEILHGDAVVQNTTRRTISSTTQSYTVQIRNLKGTDAGVYTCKWDWYRNCRRFFEVYIRLHVIQPHMSECILANGLDGVFFVGEDIELLCPAKVRLDVKINSENVPIHVTEITNGRLDNIQMVRINDITASYNNSRLSCITGLEDYCESVPTITVYDDLEVTVYPQTVKVTNGENITFTCRSFPELQASMEWDLSEIENVTSFSNDNSSMRGFRMVTLNFNFQNVIEVENQYVIKCRAILRSKQRTKEINIIPQQHEIEVTTTSGDEETKEDKQNRFAIVILIVVVVILGTMCGIIGGIFMYKRARSETVSRANAEEGYKNVEHTYYQHYYEIRRNEMQRSQNDSEVDYSRTIYDETA